MSRWQDAPGRVGSAYLSWASQNLTERDWSILESITALRVATGNQLERLHFNNLTGRSRAVVRWKVLKRLVDSRVLAVLDQPAHRRRSAAFEYTLGSAGQWLTRLRDNQDGIKREVRRLRVPGDRFVAHALDVTELHVQLVEQLRGSAAGQIQSFTVEPVEPDGAGGRLKPDAYAALRAKDVTDCWWIEVDEVTESLPTIHNKLTAYLDFLDRGQLGPDAVMPRVLITVPTESRRAAIQGVVADLPPPAEQLFSVALFSGAARFLAEELRT